MNFSPSIHYIEFILICPPTAQSILIQRLSQCCLSVSWRTWSCWEIRLFEIEIDPTRYSNKKLEQSMTFQALLETWLLCRWCLLPVRPFSSVVSHECFLSRTFEKSPLSRRGLHHSDIQGAVALKRSFWHSGSIRRVFYRSISLIADVAHYLHFSQFK